jgi:hypothetical protein
MSAAGLELHPADEIGRLQLMTYKATALPLNCAP